MQQPWARPLRAARRRTLSPALERLSVSIATRATGMVMERIGGWREQISEELRDQLRSEFVELSRMLRQQGDAADEVAETLGRALARLAAENDHLAEAVARLTREVEELRAGGRGATAGEAERSARR